MDIKEVVDGKVVEPTPSKPIDSAANVTGFPPGFLDELAVHKVLGLDDLGEQDKYKDEVKKIIEWAKSEGYGNDTELRNMIVQLQNRMGSPPLSERWVTRIARFATLRLQEKRAQQEEDRLLKGFDSSF